MTLIKSRIKSSISNVSKHKHLIFFISTLQNTTSMFGKFDFFDNTFNLKAVTSHLYLTPHHYQLIFFCSLHSYMQLN